MRHFTAPVVILSLLLVTAVSPAIGGQANTQAADRERITIAGFQDKPLLLGGGVFLGDGVGVTLKGIFQGVGVGLDALVSWSPQEESDLYVHSNVIYHLAFIETAESRFVVPSVGAGVIGRFGENANIGVRLPVALSLFLFPSFPLELYGEISPGVGIFPEAREEFGFGFGARLYLAPGGARR